MNNPIDILMEFVMGFDPGEQICKCGEPAYACTCCRKCGAAKQKYCFCEELVDDLEDDYESDPICACGEPGWACKCCWKCGSTDKSKTCKCEKL